MAFFSNRQERKTGGLARSAYGAVKSYTGTSIHRAGIQEVKELLGIARKDKYGKAIGSIFRFAGPAFMAYSAYSGYQEGGMMGAAKNIVSDISTGYAFGAGLKLAGAGAAWGLGLTAGAGVLGGGLLAMSAARQGVSPLQMLARPLVREHTKKRAKLEMGAPVQDQYGTVATMRQRSIMAMRQSKITARSALGMEGSRRYTPYLR